VDSFSGRHALAQLLGSLKKVTPLNENIHGV